MPLKVGDKVRTKDGIVGVVRLMNRDGINAYIQPDGQQAGASFILYRLDELTKVEDERESTR